MFLCCGLVVFSVIVCVYFCCCFIGKSVYVFAVCLCLCLFVCLFVVAAVKYEIHFVDKITELVIEKINCEYISQ